MLTKNFIRLLGEKLNLMGKIFILLLFSSIIFLSVSATIYNVQLKEFKKEVYEVNIPKHASNLLKDSIYSQKKAKEDIKQAKIKFSEIFQKHKNAINASIAYFIIIIFAFIMFIQTVKYILTFAIKEFMDAGSNVRLSNIYVSNFVKILYYSVVSSIIQIVLAILDIFIIYAIFRVFTQISVLVSLLLIGILSAVFVAFNYIFLGQIENMMVINNNSVFKAIKNSIIFGFKNFKVMGAHIYFLTFLSIFFVNAFGLFTFGIGYFIGGLITIISFRVMMLIDYYEINNLPYYIAKDTIYYNKNKINKI